MTYVITNRLVPGDICILMRVTVKEKNKLVIDSFLNFRHHVPLRGLAKALISATN